MARPIAVTQPSVGGGSVSTSIGYDTNGNIATRTDWNGNRTNYTYDLSRNLETSRTEGLTSAGGTTPQTRTISTQWDANFRLPTAIAEPLRITTNVYDPDGTQCGARGALCLRTVQATTDANGSQGFSATPTGSPRTWTYSYNANGSVLTVNGPRTDVADITAYSYYANDDADPGKRGNLASVSNAAGHLTSITAYNLHGQPTSIVDPNGLSTTLAYDPRQRLTSRTVGSETTAYEYDGVGQLTKITLPDGSFLTYSYDAAHRLAGMQDNLGNRIAYTLDAMGNRTAEEVRDPVNNLAQTRSRVFNNLNRLFQEIGAAAQVTEYAYDNQGNVTSIDGPLAGTVDVTANAYDALNRLVRVTDPNAGQVNYGYNALDQLASVTDPRSLVTSYGIDGLGNLNQEVSPDTGTTTNNYDAAGNVLTRTDAEGRVATYSYDALNRATQIVHTLNGSPQPPVTIALGYDAGTNGKGRLTSMSDSSGSTAWEYDAKGRVARKTQTVPGSTGPITYLLQYRYDSAGRLDQITYPSGRVVAVGFDALGRVASLTQNANTVVSNVTYFPFGQVSGFILNGQAITRSFDTDGRATGYTLPGETRVLGYDNASHITSNQRSDATDPRTYGYDVLDRLTSYVAPATTQSFNYDATGNRTGTSVWGTNYTYTTPGTSNRLSTVTASGYSRSFSYDATGNTTAVTGPQAYYAWYDTLGRLIQVTVGFDATIYRANGLGQRVMKSGTFAPSGTNYFVYDESGKLLGEYDANGAVIQETLYLNDLPVATIKGADTYFIYADHLNTPRAITNAANQLVWRWEFDPFGILNADENPSGLGTFAFNLRFPGQYFDRETNLAYNYRRDYDPSLGRYVESDPIGLRGGLNTYAYVRNNPLSLVDPKGEADWGEWLFASCEFSFSEMETCYYMCPNSTLRCTKRYLTQCGFVPCQKTVRRIFTMECPENFI